MRIWVGRVLAGAGVSAALLIGLPTTAMAAPCVIPICPTETPTPSPTPSPTPTVDPTPTETLPPAPTATRSVIATRTAITAPTTSASPTSGTTDGVLTESPSSSPSEIAVQPAVSSKKSGGSTKLVVLILGAAVLLGLAGVSGLYLTRTPA